VVWRRGRAAEAGLSTEARLIRRPAPPLGFERKDRVRMRLFAYDSRLRA
jgi:hypothetical protein